MEPPQASSAGPSEADFAAEPLDEDLMRQTQRGDAGAFSILYQRHAPRISGYLRRMLGDVEDIEGLAQEVFMRALRFAPTYRYPSRFSTWLFTIARNLAINNARSRHRSPVRNVGDWTSNAVCAIGPSAAAAVDAVDNQEEIARVLAAMEDLPAAQKEVIVLRLFQDLTYAQIGQLMGTSAVTLRSRMFHGLRKLATLVAENEHAVPAALTNPTDECPGWDSSAF
jgi:RNA polymerase sigma-70 factor (ECF subfamily)